MIREYEVIECHTQKALLPPDIFHGPKKLFPPGPFSWCPEKAQFPFVVSWSFMITLAGMQKTFQALDPFIHIVLFPFFLLNESIFKSQSFGWQTPVPELPVSCLQSCLTCMKPCNHPQRYIKPGPTEKSCNPSSR